MPSVSHCRVRHGGRGLRLAFNAACWRACGHLMTHLIGALLCWDTVLDDMTVILGQRA
jgi:hypothetical protein